jgi:hypothetical protein
MLFAIASILNGHRQSNLKGRSRQYYAFPGASVQGSIPPIYIPGLLQPESNRNGHDFAVNSLLRVHKSSATKGCLVDKVLQKRDYLIVF